MVGRPRRGDGVRKPWASSQPIESDGNSGHGRTQAPWLPPFRTAPRPTPPRLLLKRPPSPLGLLLKRPPSPLLLKGHLLGPKATALTNTVAFGSWASFQPLRRLGIVSARCVRRQPVANGGWASFQPFVRLCFRTTKRKYVVDLFHNQAKI